MPRLMNQNPSTTLVSTKEAAGDSASKIRFDSVLSPFELHTVESRDPTFYSKDPISTIVSSQQLNYEPNPSGRHIRHLVQ